MMHDAWCMMYYNLVYIIVVDGIANVVVGFFDNVAMGLDDVAGDGGDGGEALATRPFLKLLYRMLFVSL